MNKSGNFRVAVEAYDGKKTVIRNFIISVLPSRCTLNMEVSPQIIYFNMTTILYPPAPSWNERLPQEDSKTINITLWLSCRGEVEQNFSVKLMAQTVPNGFTISDAVQDGHTWILNNGNNLTLSVKDKNKTTIRMNIIVSSPKTVSSIYPGNNYTIRIVATNQNLNQKIEPVILQVFHYEPQLEIIDFSAISQTSNPSHNVWDNYQVVNDLVTYGKQAAFYFTYRFNFTYPVKAEFKVILPRNQWDWNVSSISYGDKCLIVCPEDCMPTCRDPVWVWIEDQNYIIAENFVLNSTNGDNVTEYILATRFLGYRGLWFPKPISLPAHAILIVGESSRGSLLHLSNPIRISKVFNSKNNAVGGLKIGYFIMDQSWFTQAQINEIQEKLSEKLPIYLNGIFPINVKEVWFLGYVSRPNMPGWRTSDTWAWDADTWGEMLGEANLDRGIVIVPNDALDWLNALGVVFSCEFCWENDANKVAIVEYQTLSNNIYYPIVAHELSHTFGFPDIYYGKCFPINYCTSCRYYGYANPQGSEDPCTGVPVVLGRWAFFDEINGGIITIGSPGTLDIMYCGTSSNRWAYHSWNNVARETHDNDPPVGLLISLLVYRNGTVVARPFSMIYNHTHRVLPKRGIGDVYIVLKDKFNKVLRRYPVNLSYYIIAYGKGKYEINVVPLVSVVEWFNNLESIELVDNKGFVLFKRNVSKNAPILSIKYPLNNLKLKIGNTYNIIWNGTDLDGDKLWYNVQIKKEDSLSWMIIAHRITNNSIHFMIPKILKPGRYILMVKATDGVRTGYDIVHVEITDKLPTIKVSIKSNIELKLNGSGFYEEGDFIKVTAPKEVRMKGVYGLLGGRYIFKEWSGDYHSNERSIKFVVKGKKNEIYIIANYESDITIPCVIIGCIILLIITAILNLIFRKYRNK